MPDSTTSLAEIKISELPVADAANLTDQLETNQAGVSRSITLDQVSTLVAGSDQVSDVIDTAIGAIPPPPPNDWASIPGKPATFPPTLPIPESGVTNLVSDLAGKAPVSHSHTAGDLPPYPTSLPPSGTAGGALTGTYPNPTLVGGPLSLYAPLASPVFTGDPQAPSPAAGDADFSIPTTAWVQGELAAIAPGGATLTGYWNYNSAALVPPPASGRVRLSVAWPPTLSSSMHLYIASTDVDGYSYTWALGPAVSNILVFRSASGGRAQLLVTAVSIQSGYIDVTATVQQVSGNNVNNSRCQISILANSYSPSGAAGGDLTGTYPNPLIKPSVTNGQVLTTVAGVAAWAAAAGGAATSVGTTPPGSPTDGQLWYYSDAVAGGGALYIRYNDGNTTQWVPASPAATPGSLLQTVFVETGAVATGTTLIPIDDTIPQITEGNEYMILAITPKSATSKLVIDVLWNGANSAAAGATMAVALFQDSTANALATTMLTQAGAGNLLNISLRHSMTSGTTSATTFRVRAGSATAGTTTFNGSSGARFFGGSYASSIVIQEVA